MFPPHSFIILPSLLMCTYLEDSPKTNKRRRLFGSYFGSTFSLHSKYYRSWLRLVECISFHTTKSYIIIKARRTNLLSCDSEKTEWLSKLDASSLHPFADTKSGTSSCFFVLFHWQINPLDHNFQSNSHIAILQFTSTNQVIRATRLYFINLFWLRTTLLVT